MTFLSTEEFKTHFEVTDNTLILSPQVSMIAGFCGHDDFTYISPREDIKPEAKYETVLIDVQQTDVFPNSKSRPSKWFHHSLKYLKDGGVLKGKFFVEVTSKLKTSYQINKIHMHDEYCFVDVTKTPKYKNTEVIYSTGEKVEIDIQDDVILHHYNECDYQYVKSTVPHDFTEKLVFSGPDVVEKLKETKEKSKKTGQFGLIIYNNTPSLKIEKMESSNVKSGSNCYLFSSQRERDSYYDALKTSKVLALAKNMSYNQTMRVLAQSYLINPSIIDYAKSL
jgi:hypothetical protein